MGELTVMQKQEIAKGAQAMGAIVGRYAKRKSDRLTSPLGTLSFWGRVLSVMAFTAAIVSACLMVIDASHITVQRSRAAVIARDTVNIRQAPTTGSSIVMKAHMDDRFIITGSRGSWTRIRSSDGSQTGWISSSLINTTTSKTLAVNYEMKGYFTAFLICIAIVFFALRMKRVGSSQTVRNPNETMLVNNE
ncbi:MAG: SH3 domain-containing protein [bacterium]|nr:MAG: SH3 domain-containing protein [bacterium]